MDDTDEKDVISYTGMGGQAAGFGKTKRQVHLACSNTSHAHMAWTHDGVGLSATVDRAGKLCAGSVSRLPCVTPVLGCVLVIVAQWYFQATDAVSFRGLVRCPGEGPGVDPGQPGAAPELRAGDACPCVPRLCGGQVSAARHTHSYARARDGFPSCNQPCSSKADCEGMLRV